MTKMAPLIMLLVSSVTVTNYMTGIILEILGSFVQHFYLKTVVKLNDKLLTSSKLKRQFGCAFFHLIGFCEQ